MNEDVQVDKKLSEKGESGDGTPAGTDGDVQSVSEGTDDGEPKQGDKSTVSDRQPDSGGVEGAGTNEPSVDIEVDIDVNTDGEKTEGEEQVQSSGTEKSEDKED